MEELHNYLNSIRRDFTASPIDIGGIQQNPFDQFATWFEESVQAEVLEHSAMSLATVDADGRPSVRIVYLRGVIDNGFVFYTNYLSRKGNDILGNKWVTLNFFWKELTRQIRISGIVEKAPDTLSDEYFSKRPRNSQLGAWASKQSEIVASRDDLEKAVRFYDNKYNGEDVPRPEHWGGYIVKPQEFEFWQGRPSRLHDRLVYRLDQGNKWVINRLAP